MSALAFDVRHSPVGALEEPSYARGRSRRRTRDADRAAEALPYLDEDGPDGDPPRSPLDALAGVRLRRRHLGFLAAALVVVWILLVLARAISNASATTDRATRLRTENEQLQVQLEAARRELAIVQSKEYVRLESRAYGMGATAERAFSLQQGAPPPPRIRPLGATRAEEGGTSPLEDWLELLFGG